MRAAVATFLVSLCATSVAHAVSVRAELDRDQTTVEDGAQLLVTVDGSSAGAPTLPDLPDIDVHSRGQSTQVQIVNGKMSSQVTYTYFLAPKKHGLFTIPPVQVRVGAQTYQSQPQTLKVSAGPTFGGGARDRTVFVTNEVSDAQPFVGEPVVYTFRFFRRVQVTRYAPQLPTFQGFVAEQLGEAKEYTTTIDGQKYAVAESRLSLIPLEARELTLDAPSVTAEVVRAGNTRGGGMFDDFFGNVATDTRMLRGTPTPMKVRPLPPAPPGFAGAIGRYALTATLSKERLAVGDSATLKVEVRGQGDVRRLPRPELSVPPTLKVYDEKPETRTELVDGKLGGTAVFQLALVATEAAEVTLPPVTLVYFDPDTERFETAAGTPLRITVLPGRGEALHVAGPPQGARKERVELIGDDILAIHTTSQGLWTRTGQLVITLMVAASLALPPTALAGLLWWQRRRARRARDQDAERRRTALARAKKSIEKAEQALTKSELEDATALASRAVREFLGDKLGVAGLALTAEEVRARLGERGADARLVTRMYEEAHRLEAAQYGGGFGVTAHNLTGKLAELKSMLKELDRQL